MRPAATTGPDSIRMQLVSDLHQELLPRSIPEDWHGVPHDSRADLLVLAGDIGRPADVVRLFAQWPIPVLYLLGNHEFYGLEMQTTRQQIRKLTQGTSVILLDNDEVGSDEFARFEAWYAPRKEKLAKLRIFGATLWTDYDYTHALGVHDLRDFRMLLANDSVRDHRAIAYGDVVFRPTHALAEHQKTLGWLTRELAAPFDGRTVVVSHHGPSAGSVHPRFFGSQLNAAFVSDLPAEVLGRVDLWMHGHVHDNFDYEAHGCRVVTNPRGYVVDAGTTNPTKWKFENPNFDSSLLITV